MSKTVLKLSLVFYVVSCVLLFVCLTFSFFSHGVVSLFSSYEFDCPSGIFRTSFKTVPNQQYDSCFPSVEFGWAFGFAIFEFPFEFPLVFCCCYITFYLLISFFFVFWSIEKQYKVKKITKVYSLLKRSMNRLMCFLTLKYFWSTMHICKDRSIYSKIFLSDLLFEVFQNAIDMFWQLQTAQDIFSSICCLICFFANCSLFMRPFSNFVE